ncbi:MAG: response regulator transcription factor [Anaerolineae bacterium]
MSVLNQARILVVDDDRSVRNTLKEVLSREGYEVIGVESGEEALETMREVAVDLALLDLKLTGMDGLRTMEEIKKFWPSTMIIMLTGYATLESALGALRQGAHDYLLKPCEPEELKRSVRKALEKRWREIRHRELLSRLEQGVRELSAAEFERPVEVHQDESEEEDTLKVGQLVIDLRRHTVTMAGCQVNLTPTEFAVLSCLAKEVGDVLTCEKIVSRVQGYECYEQEARMIIKTHISHLRQKLEKDPSNPKYIINVRGVGYMLSPSPEE